jgi:hypothetical protein
MVGFARLTGTDPEGFIFRRISQKTQENGQLAASMKIEDIHRKLKEIGQLATCFPGFYPGNRSPGLR